MWLWGDTQCVFEFVETWQQDDTWCIFGFVEMWQQDETWCMFDFSEDVRDVTGRHLGVCKMTMADQVSSAIVAP